MESRLSRRALFNGLSSKGVPTLDVNLSVKTKISEAAKSEKEFTRRDVLKMLGGVAALYTVGQSADNDEGEGLQKPQAGERQPIKQTSNHNLPQAEKTTPSKDKQGFVREGSYIETAIEQTLMMIAKKSAHIALGHIGIENGNKNITPDELVKYLRDKPISTIFEMGIAIPVLEEYAIRFLPSEIIAGPSKGHRWDVGIPMSALFALSHNLILKKEEEHWKFRIGKTIPLTQFMGGMFYWYLMRERGFEHAALAHSMNNGGSFAIGALLFKMYPPEEATEKLEKIA